MTDSKKNRLKSILGTVLFHIGLLLLMLFMALRTPLPLPGEQGVMVNLGNDVNGMGMDQQELASGEILQPKVVSEPEKQQKEDYLVQDVEDAPSIAKKKPEPKKKEPEKVKPKPEPEPVKEIKKAEPEPLPEPKPDPKAMYKGKGTAKQGGQEGQTGQAGDQGDPSGTPGANIYTGKGGDGSGQGTGSGTGTGPGDGSGQGISFTLGNRGSLSLYKPAYDSREQGKVVVTIKVDKKGNVTSAVPGAKGTTVSDQTLWQLAKNAALKSKFEADDKAAELQVGTITYTFIRQN